MPTPANHNVQITVHVLWPCANPLPSEAWVRLPTYVTRYARTLGVPTVYAVGGTSDHLHLLFDLPMDKTLRQIVGELQTATARFLRDTLGAPDFAWSALFAAWSVGASEQGVVAAYVADNAAHHEAGAIRSEWEWEGGGTSKGDEAEETPLWLREAMGAGG